MTKLKVKKKKETVEEKKTLAVIKKKRPWRDKVRKKAKKEAARQAREEKAKEIERIRGPAVGDEKKKKKKKKKKKEQAIEETKPEDDGSKKLKSARFRYLNEQLYTMTGKEAFDMFKDDPTAFEAYHKGYAAQTKKWPNTPLAAILAWLHREKPGQVVLDLGCGEAKIAESIGDKHDVRSFDLVAVNERVTACDMAKLPVKDGEADIAIFCLSLMGTNLADFLREARRALREGGTLKIAEVSSRFSNVRLFLNAVKQLGFEVVEKKNLTDYFTLMEFTKKGKVQSKRPFGLVLNPCLYKKR